MVADSQQVQPQFTDDHARRMFAKRIRGIVRSILIHASLVPAAIIFTLPFLWMLSTSLKPDVQFYAYPPVIFPSPLQWSNYPDAVTFITFFLYLRNTLTIAVLSTIGVLLSSSLVAYSLARIPWAGRNFLFILTVATLMLPFQVTLIPLIYCIQKFGG